MSSRTTSFRTCLELALVAGAALLLLTDPIVAQPPGFGGDRRAGGQNGGRGGPPGGREGGGGSRGRGGGPPGGFDPTFLLQRMDRNGNGKLDPNEVDGRAKFMIERFAPGVDTSKSISFDDIKKRIQAAREGRDSSRDRSGRGGDRRSTEQPAIEIEPLVPGFGEEIELEPVPGFGGSGAFFAVATTDADEAEANRTIGRYDRNKNGRLDREEIRQGRWSDDPTTYDQNGDGTLSKQELSVRYAKRRIAKESENDDRRERERRSEQRDRRKREQERDGDRNQEDQEDRKSYRFLTASERLPKGIPDWFRDKDADSDGQVRMSEYAVEWDDETVGKFTSIDTDANGIVSPAEALQAVATSSEASSGADQQPGVGPDSEQEIPQKYLDYAKSYVKKYDENGDGVLSQDEVESMRRPPKNADLDGDGKIAVEEFARSIMR